MFLPRSDQPRDIRAVLDLMGREKLSVSDLIRDIRFPEQALAAYTHLKAPESGVITVAFDWSEF